MSSTSVHKISVVLPATDYQEAGRLQSAAKHWASHSLPALLNRHLESLHRDQEVVYIEKVTIDIPDLPWNLGEAAWQKMIAEAIQVEQLAVNPLALIVQQWVFYLSHGCWEKAALLTSRQEVENYLLAHAGQWPVMLEKELSAGTSLSLWQRLVAGHTAPLVRLFLEVVLGIRPEQAVHVYEVLRPALKAEPAPIYRLLSKIVVMNREIPPGRKAYLLDQLLRSDAAGPVQEDQREKPQQEEIIDDSYKKKPLTDTYITCPHAGLVLLFPYIKPFFENGGLVKDEVFVSEAAQWRAVQALHFLATGISEAGEEAGVLPKLLCGVDLSAFMEWEDALPLTLQTEADELLEAVIGHWKVLQHTSIAGFRETFLQRPGQLIPKGDTYTLQVEGSGVDILLNSIPWGFRNYRLPWMPGNLITEWY